MRHWAKHTTCGLALAAPLFVLPAIAMAAGDTILYVDDDAPPGGDGLSWNTAYRFLADALTAAGDLSDASEIRVGRGTYTPDRSEGAPRGSGDREAALELIDGWVLLGGFAGFGAEDPDARDVAAFETVLSGDLLGNDGPDFANNGENSYHVMFADNVDATIDGLTIRAGHADGGPFYNEAAGVQAWEATLTIANCLFTGNTSQSSGGAIGSRFDSVLFLVDCRFIGNRTLETHGGAVDSDIGCDATFERCEFTENVALQDGGAYSGSSGTHASFIDCVFTSNSAKTGGAIDSSGLSVVNCDFADNTAGDVGGAISIIEGSVQRSTFSGNSGGSGGAVKAGGDGLVSLQACTFSGNTAIDQYGGAVNCDEGILDAEQCIFELNEAEQLGGAVNCAGSAEVTLRRCDFIANSAALGGGAIYSGADQAVYQECTFARNKAKYGGGLLSNDNALVIGCTFIGNETYAYGGGGLMAYYSAEPLLMNCLFISNKATVASGGAVASIVESNPVLINCTLVGNSAKIQAGGLSVGYPFPVHTLDYLPPSQATVFNCVFWDNVDQHGQLESSQIFALPAPGDTVSVDYSCIEGLTGALGGSGNIGDDPLFVDQDGPDGIPGTEDDDLRLGAGSPGIDAAFNNAVPDDVADLDDDGDLTEFLPFDLDGEPRFADDTKTDDTGCGAPAIVDMGAYEFLGIPIQPIRGDITGDLSVDGADLIELLGAWGECATEDDGEDTCCAADLNADGVVDGGDLLLMLGNWS